MRVRSLYELFKTLPDPRAAEGRRYQQAGVLALVMMALIAQQNSLNQIATWVAALDPAVGARLGFRFNRMPSYSTIRRVLLNLDVHSLGHALQLWAHQATQPLCINSATSGPPLRIAIDGKTLRGSAEPTEQLPAIRLLSAFVHDLGVTLAQLPIAPTTNEVASLPTLLDQVVLDGLVLTLDAHYTTRDVISNVRKKGGMSSYGSKTTSHTCCAR